LNLGNAVAEVFISYSRREYDFVRQLGDALVARQRKVWIDWKDIPLTAEWWQEIIHNIDAAQDFLFVISPDSVASPTCRKEIEYAAANHKRMVPIFYSPVPDEAIPESLNKFQRIDFRSADDFDEKFTTLVAALDTDLDWKQAHTRLLTRAKEWEREGRDRSFLLRGKDLGEAEQWIARSAELEPKPNMLQSDYVLVSRQAATTLQRVVIGAVSAALVVAIGLSIYAFRQRNMAQQNARASKGRELAAYATANLGEDPERSILLGMQAVNATLHFGQPPVPAAAEALHQAILSSHVRLTLRGHADAVASVIFSPDGSRLATASADKTVKVWNAVNGQELLTLRGHADSVLAVAFSPEASVWPVPVMTKLRECGTQRPARNC
jgi:hypothetical protein